MTDAPRLVVNNKTDAELAADIRVDVIRILGPVLEAMNRAAEAGFQVSFSLGADFNKRAIVQTLSISKQF